MSEEANRLVRGYPNYVAVLRRDFGSGGVRDSDLRFELGGSDWRGTHTASQEFRKAKNPVVDPDCRFNIEAFGGDDTGSRSPNYCGIS